MHRNHHSTAEMPSAEVSLRMLIISIVIVGTAFFMAKHDAFFSLYEIDLRGSRTTLGEAAAASGDLVASGSVLRQIGFTLLGATGFWYFIMPANRRFTPWNIMALLLLMSLAWCAASAAWSSAPMLTVKRVAALVLTFIGAIGISRRLSAKQLTQLALFVSLIFVITGLIAELALGQFTPWADDYRFAGTVHPTHPGPISACLALAAGSFLLNGHRSKALFVAIALGCITLLLTRTRASVFGFMAGVGTIWMLQAHPRQRVTALVTSGWAVVTALLFFSIFGLNEETVDVAALGRSESLASLSGRIPLWTQLMNYVHSQPLQGYGYSAFWTPDRIADIARSINWVAPSAHSAYLSVVLYIGLAGAAMVFPAILIGTYRLYRKQVLAPDPGTAFLLGLTVFGMVQGLFASNFSSPDFVTFIAMCGMAQVAFYATSTDNLPDTIIQYPRHN